LVIIRIHRHHRANCPLTIIFLSHIFALHRYLQQFGEFMALVVFSSLVFASLIYPAMLSAFVCGKCMKREIEGRREAEAWCRATLCSSTKKKNVG
jgi:hypothetical protein